MSLDGWLGRPTRKVDPRSLSPLLKTPQPARVVFGFLGTRSSLTYEDMEGQILAPAMEAWGTPDELILPAEGDSSQALMAWATRRQIPCRIVASDWALQGRRAGLLRDARIQRESTHLILLQGPRSTALSALARRLIKKRPVAISERPGQPLVPASAL
jgi:threonine synthase